MIKRLAVLVPMFVLSLFPLAAPAAAGEGGDWQLLLAARFGNIDAIDAEDGDLARFLGGIRNDGRFPPPMRTLIGPEIRNPTFFGLVFEAWLEGVLLVPARPGPAEHLWVFPVDSRDEYLTQLAGQGLAEYEGMDGVTVLRETDSDGNIRDWYLEWLPGNVVLFGANRAAVTAARRMYAESGGARGLLAGAGGRFVEPDLMIRMFPARLAAWQDREPGIYWWRETVGLLAKDLAAYWKTSPARTRLLNSLAEDVISRPLAMEQLQLSVWFEEQGLEWRLESTGEYSPVAPPSQLGAMRRLPDRIAAAYGVPLDGRSFAAMGSFASRLLLGAAGGVATADAKEAAFALFSQLAAARPAQMAAAWVPPPVGKPELGGARLLVVEWGVPQILDVLWPALLRAVGPDGPARQAFSQMGWQVELRQEDGPGTAQLVIRSSIGDPVKPYCDAALAVRRNGPWLALAAGENRADAEARREVFAYRADLAAQAVAAAGPGGPGVRNAFTRAGPGGASFLAVFDPVLFMQMCLAEAADWRPRSPDQPEPLSTQLAREMLGYMSGGAWTVEGDASPGKWVLNGGMSWQSLTRLSAALGITESIGMD